jgi:hypothetical protein
LAGFKADYQAIFVEEWSPFVGAMLLVLTIIGLMLSGLVWGVFGGVKFWGDWFNNLIGLGPVLGIPQETRRLPDAPHVADEHHAGAWAPSPRRCLSRQFSPNRPPPLEYVWAASGGSLLGIGAALAGGCTTGGFFNPVLHSSPAGWAMWRGLLAGAAIGLKLLLWTLDHIEWGMQAPPALDMPEGLRSNFPWLGLAGDRRRAALGHAMVWLGRREDSPRAR